MKTKGKATTPAPIAPPRSNEWRPWTSGDHDAAFVIRGDIEASDCYDAATLRMEQAERLLIGEREAAGDDFDPVIIAALALLSQARAAYRAAFARAAQE